MRHRAIGSTLLAAGAIVVAGCTTVGPDYVSPVPSAPDAWQREIGKEMTAADPAAYAAWTVVANVLLNLDAFLNKG